MGTAVPRPPAAAADGTIPRAGDAPRAGLSIFEVQQRIGQHSPNLTAEVYTHLMTLVGPGEAHGSVGERPEEDARVVALPPRSEPDVGRGRQGRRWVFHGEVQTISGPEADRIRAELADVIRDLLLWAAGEATENSGSEEEAA